MRYESRYKEDLALILENPSDLVWKRTVLKGEDNMNLILSLFRKLFGIEPFKSQLALIKGTAGTVTHQARCGCVLKAEHDPKKHLWIFQYDYSHCNRTKEAIQEIMELK